MIRDGRHCRTGTLPTLGAVFFVRLLVSFVQVMIEARIAKAIIVASLAVFALLVAFDNLADYATN
jgi:hypothetical protein